MLSYIQGIMLAALEIICCKIFFESFGKKRRDSNWQNCAIIFCTIICCYLVVLTFHNKFILKQILIIAMIALFMSVYVKVQLIKSIVLSLLFQGLLLSIDWGKCDSSVSKNNFIFNSCVNQKENRR